MTTATTNPIPYTKWDEFTDWKELCPAEDGKAPLDYRVVEKNKYHVVVSIRGRSRSEVVARTLKSVLSDNQGMFGLHGAGIEHYSGAIPLYSPELAVAGYVQDFRFTKGL